jgi:type IV pilus assembly protein PilX
MTIGATHTSPAAPGTERGAALAVGLLMLVILTVLAITGMSTATMELTMAGNTQQGNRAFEAAASVLESELRRDDIEPLESAGTLPAIPANTNRAYVDQDGNTIATGTARTSFVATTGTAGWQLGATHAFSAHHFEAQANGASARGAVASQLQGYYVIGPTL